MMLIELLKDEHVRDSRKAEKQKYILHYDPLFTFFKLNEEPNDHKLKRHVLKTPVKIFSHDLTWYSRKNRSVYEKFETRHQLKKY